MLRVEVRITSAVDVAAVPFDLRFDPTRLRYERALQGEFLARSGTPPLLLVAPVGDGSAITVGLSLAGTGSGVSGSGTLLALEFRAIAAGSVDLLFDSARLLNSRRREVAAEFIPSQITVL
jgi:hypothetical protein